MLVTREDVLRCATLTRLNLQEEEIEPLRHDMEQLLSHAESLNVLPLDGVEPYAQDRPLPRREDTAHETFTQEQALANAPQAERGHFVVPRVM